MSRSFGEGSCETLFVHEKGIERRRVGLNWIELGIVAYYPAFLVSVLCLHSFGTWHFILASTSASASASAYAFIYISCIISSIPHITFTLDLTITISITITITSTLTACTAFAKFQFSLAFSLSLSLSVSVRPFFLSFFLSLPKLPKLLDTHNA